MSYGFNYLIARAREIEAAHKARFAPTLPPLPAADTALADGLSPEQARRFLPIAKRSGLFRDPRAMVALRRRAHLGDVQPADYDCRAEVGREGLPCRICAAEAADRRTLARMENRG